MESSSKFNRGGRAALLRRLLRGGTMAAQQRRPALLAPIEKLRRQPCLRNGEIGADDRVLTTT